MTDRFEAGEVTLEPMIDYLTSLSVEFEDVYYPIPESTPKERLVACMEQFGYKQGDIPQVACRTVINEILRGKGLKYLRTLPHL